MPHKRKPEQQLQRDEEHRFLRIRVTTYILLAATLLRRPDFVYLIPLQAIEDTLNFLRDVASRPA